MPIAKPITVSSRSRSAPRRASSRPISNKAASSNQTSPTGTTPTTHSNHTSTHSTLQRDPLPIAMLAFQYSAPPSSPNYNNNITFATPLSPRSANIYGRTQSYPHQMLGYMSPSPHHQPHCDSPQPPQNENSASIFNPTSTSKPTAPATPFSRRPIKQAPLPTQSTLKSSRNEVFLRRVSARREERRFEARGDDILRTEFLVRQRAWEEERAREAEQAAAKMLEEEDEPSPLHEGDRGMQMSTQPLPLLESEGFIPDEDAELEAMLEEFYLPSSMALPQRDELPTRGEEQMQKQDEEDGREAETTSLWSDDADYDDLFSEVMMMSERPTVALADGGCRAQDAQMDQHVRGDDEMDIS